MTVWAYVERPSLVVLVLRRVPARAAGWQPVTGRVEPGEAPEAACARELAEEAGLPAPDALDDLGPRAAFVGVDGETYRPRAYAARYARARPPVVRPDEHEDARWVAPREARDMLRWDDDRATLDLLLGRLGQASNS